MRLLSCRPRSRKDGRVNGAGAARNVLVLLKYRRESPRLIYGSNFFEVSSIYCINWIPKSVYEPVMSATKRKKCKKSIYFGLDTINELDSGLKCRKVIKTSNYNAPSTSKARILDLNKKMLIDNSCFILIPSLVRTQTVQSPVAV